MSFILDALKKSENARQRQIGPAIAFPAAPARVTIGQVASVVKAGAAKRGTGSESGRPAQLRATMLALLRGLR